MFVPTAQMGLFFFYHPTRERRLGKKKKNKRKEEKYDVEIEKLLIIGVASLNYDAAALIIARALVHEQRYSH